MLRTKLYPTLIFLSAFVAACAGPDATPPSPPQSSLPPEPVAASVTAPDESDERPLVIFLGDSLTAGFGLDEEQAFPALVARRLTAEGTPIRVLNAGVSGDTTAGGLRQLDWLLRQAPDVMVVALGGNDALRALDPTMTEENLRQIIERSKASGARVLLAGMRAPPNLGPDYAEGFAALYPRLAEELDTALLPFLLEGVGGVEELNQADGIHPTAEGQRRIAELILPPLRQLIAEL